MPNEVDPVEQINITRSVAVWLMETCIGLVRHYLGREFNPELGTFTDRNRELPAMEDRVPIDDFEFRYWTSGVINLITTIAGILNHALSVGRLMRIDLIEGDSPDSDITESGEI